MIRMKIKDEFKITEGEYKIRDFDDFKKVTDKIALKHFGRRH